MGPKRNTKLGCFWLNGGICFKWKSVEGRGDEQEVKQDAGDDLDGAADIVRTGMEGKADLVLPGGDGKPAEHEVGADDGDFVVVDIGMPATVVVDFAKDGEARAA